MKVVVAGGSGFIGRHLVAALRERGDEVVLFTRAAPRDSRSPSVKLVTWTPGVAGEWQRDIAESDAVVNLSGEPIAERRWTEAQKQRIVASRVETTTSIVRALLDSAGRRPILVNASAIGYYGSRGAERLTETSEPGQDFLAGVCRQWESATEPAMEGGIRTVLIRTGIVLAGDGGALPRMALPFRLFGGGLIGPRDQYVSWIQIEDEVGLLLLAIDNPGASGAMNATSPNPETMERLSRSLGAVLHRPVWVPGLPRIMSLALGQRVETVFASQRVVPAKAEELGYEFRFSDLEPALRASLG